MRVSGMGEEAAAAMHSDRIRIRIEKVLHQFFGYIVLVPLGSEGEYKRTKSSLPTYVAFMKLDTSCVQNYHFFSGFTFPITLGLCYPFCAGLTQKSKPNRVGWRGSQVGLRGGALYCKS